MQPKPTPATVTFVTETSVGVVSIAYSRGLTAGRIADSSVEDNPYDPNSVYHTDWNNGFQFGRDSINGA